MSGLKISFLGPTELECDGTPVHFERRKAVALLAYLSLCGREESRDTLAALLWPDQDRSRSLASLRRALRSLNEAFQGRFLTATRKSIGLQYDDQVWVDALQFEDLIQAAQDDSDLDTEAENALAEAIGLYRGDFLTGFGLRHCESFEEWQISQSDRLRRDLARTLRRLTSHLRSQGNYDDAVTYAQKWLSLDNLDEEVHRFLMELYALAGQRSLAVRQYEQCQAILDEELQVSPEPETQELFESVKEGRLKTGASGRARVGRRPDKPIHNLPEPATAFVGRTGDLARIDERLEDPSCRLLSLVGSGGIGKTRLSLEAARRRIGSFSDGVYFVSLVATTPGMTPSVIAQSLRIELDPQGDHEAQLVNRIRDYEALLILDNFEEVVEAAPLVARILVEASRLKIIVTSRERLNLQGEWLLEIGGLSVPAEDQIDKMTEFSAVQLFLQAARRVKSDFEPADNDKPAILEICRLVAGTPLGLELSASWLRILSCSEIVDEIVQNLDFLTTTYRDLPERHRSLRAVFDSSVNLIGDDERRKLGRLSVFQGGLDRKAAQSVARASLNTLLGLVDKSLLLQMEGPKRFQLHDLIHQFSRELLQEDPDEDHGVREMHREYYLEYLKTREDDLKGDRQKQAIQQVRREIENIRAAWGWAVEQKTSTGIDGCLGAFYQYQLLASRLEEGERMLDSAASALSGRESALVRARVQSRQGRFCILLGRFKQAKTLLEESLEVFGREDTPNEVAFALSYLSEVQFHLGEFDSALKLSEESLSLYRMIGDRNGTANSLINLGKIAGGMGQHGKSRQCLNEGHVIFEDLGDLSGMGRCLVNLGVVAGFSGFHLESVRILREALDIFSQLDDVKGKATCLNNLGLIFERLGQSDKAKEYILQAVDVLRETGQLEAEARALEGLGRITFTLQDLDSSGRYFAESLRTASKIEAIPTALVALNGLARLLANQGRAQEAVLFLSYVANHPNVGDEARVSAERSLADLQVELTADQLEEAETAGRKRELDWIVSKALEHFKIDSPTVH